ncbi:SHOCT domain-containing protein [Pseudomonas sp.]|uniref:SHOCT domain-containing protein n=1 Tax=Pseudomonas sp. TaxID=306 RepID=UPI002735F0F5|nr:SHOCT domain-containing protein [Pseudomonas sp.]MDP3815787.1 SHOCT domain-containing protein [Pseudomonas sp.]
MLSKLKELAGKAKDAISSTAVLIGDLNGDGKVDEEDARIATEWAKKTASTIGDEAGRLGKEAMRSDLAKDAASGAAIGAAVAIPVPVIGPIAGAAIGAGLGIYKNFTKKSQSAPIFVDHIPAQKDVHAELIKLDELRQKNIISDAEFEEQKKKVLNASA